MWLLTLGGEIAQSSSAVTLNFNARGLGQRNENLEHAEVEQVRLELVTKSENRDGCSHLRLHRHWHVQYQLLAFLHRTRIENESLVAVRAGGQIPQGRDGVALNLLIVRRAEKVDKGLQETSVDDGRLVHRMNRDVADASDG